MVLSILSALLLLFVGMIIGQKVQPILKIADFSVKSDGNLVVTLNLDEIESTEVVEKIEKQEEIKEDNNREEILMQGNTPVERYGKLKVSGKNLTDMSGNIVQLKGISTHDLAWYPEYVNKEFFQQMRDEWNAELVRLACYTAEEGGYCRVDESGKENLKNIIRDGVKYATELGLYVIIDWHILEDYNPLENMEESKKFFAEMSKEYGNYENVIYEICNEPNKDCQWQDIKQYANEIIPIIRENDKDAVILVGTPNWSQFVNEPQNDPITGYENLMYVLHFYADTHRDDLRNTLKTAYDAGLPLFVSEFGTCDASGDGAVNLQQADEWIALLDECQISYAVWSLSNKDETCAFFKPECKKTSGFTADDLKEQAQWYVNVLAK